MSTNEMPDDYRLWSSCGVTPIDGLALAPSTKIMRIEEAALGLCAAALPTILLLSWRRNRKIARCLTDLTVQRDQAESEKARLMQALSLRDAEENERICRLEHDVKSPLSVILGFSSLLRELVEHDGGASPLPLKNINAIHQAATKILRTMEAAVKGRDSREGQAIIADGKN